MKFRASISNNGATGFTLFEVLVAVSIFALIAAMAMSNLIQVGQTGERVTNLQRQLADIQFALGYIGKDLIQLSNRKVRDQYGDEKPQLSINDSKLAFTRAGWSSLVAKKRSNLQRVEYILVDETLERIHWPHLDQGYQEYNIRQTLLSGVEKFSIALLTKGKNKISSWPVSTMSENSEKPVAIELSFELAGFGQIQRIYELSDTLL